MKFLLLIGLFGASLAGELSRVSVRMPFLNPAGVTYTSNAVQHFTQPYAYTNPHAYTNPYAYTTSFQKPLAPLPLAQHYTPYSAPYTPSLPIHTPKIAYTYPPLLNSIAPVPKYIQAPYVPKVQVAPVLFRDLVDVAKPKVTTRKFEVRRPAIQKEFYDIEETIRIRPAGSAVVELDEPISKKQSSVSIAPAPLLKAHALHSVPLFAHQIHTSHHYPTAIHFPAHHEQGIAPSPSAETPATDFPAPPSAAPAQDAPSPSEQFQQIEDSESISVENPDIARSRMLQNQPAEQKSNEQPREEAREEINSPSTPQPAFRESEQPSEQPDQTPLHEEIRRFLAGQPSLARSHSIEAIPSVRSQNPSESRSNQDRLLDLLTAKGGIAEVRSAGESGQVRARVLSVTPAPPTAKSAEEKVSTRRIVVNRPIQTIQEVEVSEPFTKIERIAVDRPGYLKTAHVPLAPTVPLHASYLAQPLAYKLH